MDASVTISQAAAELGRSVSTLQAWVRQGAPTDEPGGVGRGKGARVNVRKLREWRVARIAPASASAPACVGVDIELVSKAVWRAFTKPPEGETLQTWKRLRLPETAVAALMLDVFRTVHREATGHYPERLPAEMTMILGIVIDSARQQIRAPTKELT